MRAGYPRNAVLVAILLLSSACAASAHRTAATPPSPTTVAPTASPTPTVDPASVHADELGRIPVLMYHRLVADPKDDYDQTPAQFRAELELLYRSGYRTITAADLVARRIDVPAGKSPMVLTFDDSTRSQYSELPGGRVDPACAVGILLDVAHRYGEMHPVATFYVNAAPFGGHDSYLADLARLGMELGDHTATHANLGQLDDSAVQRELAGDLTVIHQDAPGAQVTTMALPYGVHPKNRVLAYRGAGYRFAAVLLVGSNPARSPYSKGFDPLALPRIRSGRKSGDQSFTSTYWLPRLLATRYVSDGNPSVISFPRAQAGLLDPRFQGQARAY